MEKVLTLGIPKGSLEESTLSLFGRAGYSFHGSSRSFWLSSNDPEVKPVLLRPQEIPLYVASRSLDGGLSGLDWITETNCNDGVRILADLCYSKRSFRPVRWVLAVDRESEIQTVDDLRKPRSQRLRISTELRSVTENWLAQQGIMAEVDFSWGATEAKVPVFADAIVECTETGASLQANGLRIIETVFESKTQFFACKETYREDAWKREKLDGIALLLMSCLQADTKVRVQLQTPPESVDAVTELLAANGNYSVWQGHDNSMLIDVIMDKEKARDLIPALVRRGATRVSSSPLGMLY
jgi:ATP phosphoribosyltransferase